MTSEKLENILNNGGDNVAISASLENDERQKNHHIRLKVLKISSSRQSDSEVTTGGSKDNENDARRISRRNAMAGIYGRDAANSISHLSDCLENLSIEADRNMNVAGREPNQPSM